MASNYPDSLDSFTNPSANDSLNSSTVPHATQHANANDAIVAIESTLGTNPQGSSASVKARLDAVDSSLSQKTVLFQQLGIMQCSQVSSGSWFLPTAISAIANNMTANVIYFIPFYVDQQTRFLNMGFNVSVGYASTVIRMGVYSADSSFKPTTLLLDSGTIDTSTSGAKSASIDLTLTTGLYYAAAVSSGGTTQPRCNNVSGSPIFYPALLTTTSQPTNAIAGAWYGTATNGTLTSNPTLTVTQGWATPSANAPAISFKKA